MAQDSRTEVQTVRLSRIDSHGTTRAPYRGRWIEVEHGIPGETVRVEITGGRRPRGRIVDILEAAPDRVVPPCPYFREWQCGGCQWQQISYEGQLARKQESVEAAMRQHQLPFTVTAVHALDVPWRYRSTAGISLGKRAGFRRHGSLAIVPIRDCPISHPLIGQLMASLNDCLEDGRLPDFHGRVRLEVRLAEVASGEALQVLVRPDEDARTPEGDLAVLTEILSEVDQVAGVSIARPGGSVERVRGDLFAPVTVLGRPVWLAAGSFFQTNLRLLPELIGRLQQEASPLASKRIADIYGGVGIFGLFLAGEAESVRIVESDPLAVEAARITAREWGLNNVELLVTTAEDAASGRHEVVILDPPRSGLSQPVIEALTRDRPPLILYISCLADSLARDLTALLEAGYRLEHLELFDFYPQTYHVELLAVLRQSSAAQGETAGPAE